MEVITNDITREAMVRKSLKRIQDHVRQMPGEIEGLRAQLAAATSADQRAELASSLRQAEQYLAEVRALRPALPTMAFERTMRILRRDREIHLLFLGRAHTEGDVFVFLPKEKVVVTGDAVIGWTPFMGDGYPQDWPDTLRRLEQLDFDRMILGHGQVAGRDWLRTFRSYVEDLVEAVRREVCGRHEPRRDEGARAGRARPAVRGGAHARGRDVPPLAHARPRQHRARLPDGQLRRPDRIGAHRLRHLTGCIRRHRDRVSDSMSAVIAGSRRRFAIGEAGLRLARWTGVVW